MAREKLILLVQIFFVLIAAVFGEPAVVNGEHQTFFEPHDHAVVSAVSEFA